MGYVSARAKGKSVVYTDDQGKQWIRIGGTRAWRNNNPGNIRRSTFADEHGAIGAAGGFAVFPDESTGTSALAALLTGNHYKSLSIFDAVTEYAPPGENDTERYKKNIAKLTGLNGDTKLEDLSDSQMASVCSAIRTLEGWKVGTERLATAADLEEPGGKKKTQNPRQQEDKKKAGEEAEANDQAVEIDLAAGGGPLHGIDISHYQGDIDWDLVAKQVDFVFLKATQGLTILDEKLKTNRDAARAHGLIRGYYHFAVPADDAEKQASFFCDTLGALEPGELDPVLDLEWTKHGNEEKTANASWGAADREDLFEWTRTFVQAVQKRYPNRSVILYTGHAFWNDRVGGSDAFIDCPLWIARYTRGDEEPPEDPAEWAAWAQEKPLTKWAPWKTWAFWQFTDDARVKGIPKSGSLGKVDADLFNGSSRALRRMARLDQVAFPLKDKGAKEHYEINEKGYGGFFPVGANNFWHGGAHFTTDAPLVCVADGEFLAHRASTAPLSVKLDGAERSFSNDFALVRHKRYTPKGAEIVFYSLYLHLLPVGMYSDEQRSALPPMLTRPKIRVATREDGKGLAVLDDIRGAVVGHIPKGAVLTVLPGEVPANARGYRKVQWNGVTGFAYIDGHCDKVTSTTYRVTTAEDSPPEERLGLNVRDKARGANVLRVLPFGSEIVFKDTAKAAPAGSVVAGWHELAGGGFVYARTGKNKTVEVERVLDPNQIDKVVKVVRKVSAGMLLGYPGPYMNAKSTAHVEIFTGNVDFMKNPKGDEGASALYRIPKGTTFKKRKKLPDKTIDAVIPAGSRLSLLKQPQGQAHRLVECAQITGWAPLSALGTWNGKGKYFTLTAPLDALHVEPPGGGAAEKVQIGAKKGERLVARGDATGDDREVTYILRAEQRAKLKGWAARSALGTWDPKKKLYTLEETLRTLYEKNPEQAWDFTEDAGKSAGDLFVLEARPPGEGVCLDGNDKVWQEVQLAPEQPGWIALSQPGIEKTSPYAWPEWSRVEEGGKLSEDGICDVPEIIAAVDADKNAVVTSTEIRNALADPLIAAKLRRLAAKHPTEWAGELKGIERLSGAPWQMSQDTLKSTKEYIKKLGFWEDLKDAGLPAKGDVWHFHPVGFIEQLKLLDTTSTKPIPVRRPTRRKDVESPGKPPCPAHPLDEAVDFIVARMKENLGGNEMEYLRERLQSGRWTLGVDTLQAYWRWYELVRSGAPWDYKRVIVRNLGKWCCDYSLKTHYEYDIWSNIHYGYLGLAAGFPEWNLLSGAGVAQLFAGRVPPGYWSRRLEVIGDADVFSALDDPHDKEAVKVGFDLWKKHKEAISKDIVLKAVRERAAKLSTAVCDAQKEPEKKKLPAVRVPINASVGAGGKNDPGDVKLVKERLIELGFNWLKADIVLDKPTVWTIKLFQSITHGVRKVAGDGRIDKDGPAHQWLESADAPQWRLMSASGVGFENYERADTSDTHDYGTSWLDDTIIGAGKKYEDDYRSKNPKAALLSLNDASLPRGGDTSHHKGHETGIDIDVRLPRTDGKSGGITHSSDDYDQSAMRAMLKAFQAQPRFYSTWFNDPDLIKEKLCARLDGHDNHAHVNVVPPKGVVQSSGPSKGTKAPKHFDVPKIPAADTVDVLIVYGGTPPKDFGRKFMKKKVPPALFDAYLVALADHTSSLDVLLPELESYVTKQLGKKIGSRSVTGFSAGGQTILQGYAKVKDYELIGLIDPSVPENAVVAGYTYSARVKMIYREQNWTGKYAHLGKRLPPLAEKIRSAGGTAEWKDLKHEDMPAAFFKSYVNG